MSDDKLAPQLEGQGAPADSNEQGGQHITDLTSDQPWPLDGPSSGAPAPDFYKGTHPNWRTASEVVTPESVEDSLPLAPAPDGVVDTPSPASSVPALAPVPASPAGGADNGPVDVVQESVGAAQGVVDLTDESVQTEDSVRIPASSYTGQQSAEPVPGTVEVDRSVTQSNQTVVMPMESVLDERKAARARALGEVEPGADVVAAPQLFAPPSTYKAWPSFVLIVLRLVVATILSIRATQELLNFTQVKNMWTNSILPNPEIVAVTEVVLQYLIALMLLLGLASRVAGLLLMVLYICVLSFLVWGAVNPFASGVIGFRGELEVVMVLLGLVFAGIGGGSAAVDGAVHRARLERKNAKIS